MDKIQTSEIAKFETMFLEHLQKNHPYVIEDIQKTQALNKDNDEKLGKILTDFMAQGLFKAKSGN